MGSMPRLKDKELYRYRKGHTNDSQNCVNCESFVPFTEHDETITLYGRCNLFGVKESVRYRVRKDYTCDRQETSKAYLAMVEKWKSRFRKEAS